ncbi:DUF4743 domain-containing protein [Granulosicoccaceae sp. 1_MG-2023]|nr:DUF4743 domain-containing protein [Granulosicoccaceae sp. 1_MG-2023]
MSYLERIENCNRYDLSRFRPFTVGERRFGWVRDDFAAKLREFDKVFKVSDSAVAIAADLDSYEARSSAAHEVIAELHARGDIDTWVNEPYPVTGAFDEEPVMEVERSSILYLGLPGFGIHMNGLVQTDEGIHVWIGTRSREKPFFPGMLDQMVAGGQPLRISLEDNLVKECAEEANIPEALARTAQPRGTVHYMQECSRGLDISTIFLYDLWLPEDFEPENTDGEVESFALIPLDEVARLTNDTTLFKDNCNLVNVDLLIRSGLITADHADFQKMTDLLYTVPY